MPQNLWPQKLIELLDVAPVWPDNILPGSALILNEDKDGFKWGEQAGQGPQGDPGPTGDPGPPNILSIGTVTKGTVAEVTITGTSPAQVLNFVVPQGDPGEPGTNGTDGTNGTNAVNPEFTIGGVGIGEPAVALTGIYPDLALNFTLPEGVEGPEGDIGPSNTLTIGTVEVGATAAATLTGVSPNQVLNLTLPPGPSGLAGVVQEVVAGTNVTVDNTDPSTPVISVEASSGFAEVVEVTVSGSLVASNEGQYIRANSAGAIDLTVPLDLVLTDPFAEIHIRQAGAGLVSLVAAGGVTINPPYGGTLSLAGQGATVTLKKVATNEYDLR